jgi:hypothetical protein
MMREIYKVSVLIKYPYFKFNDDHVRPKISCSNVEKIVSAADFHLISYKKIYIYIYIYRINI